MFDPRQLDALAAILRTGSFEAAAAALSVTPSAVSQRLRALEDGVGAVLVVRAQPVRATAAGARLLRHADEVARLAREVAGELGLAGGGTARLRIAVTADSLATWVLPALAEVPDTLFDIVVDDQDHSGDLLRRGEVAAAITAGPAQIQGCDAVPLGALRYVATCAPGFHARWFGAGLAADTLGAAPALVFDEKDALQHRWAEAVTGRRVRLPAHRLPSATAFVEAARLGLGWGMTPLPLAAPEIAAGRLVLLAPDRPLDTPLVWQSSRIGRAGLAPLSAAVRRAARAVLVPPS
jgi:LysR family transcriptional regulator (chromosome initiation inhibitor)